MLPNMGSQNYYHQTPYPQITTSLNSRKRTFAKGWARKRKLPVE